MRRDDAGCGKFGSRKRVKIKPFTHGGGSLTQFFCIYLGVSLIAVLLAFVLSYRETPQNKCKAFLLALYIVTIVGVLFATGVLEAKYEMHRLYSTLIAAAVFGALYGADALGGKLRKKK